MTVFSHVGQCVRELDRARAFYTEVFGFEEVLELDVSGSQSAKLLRLGDEVTLRTVYLRRDGLVLELLAFTDPAPEAFRERALTEPGLTHLSIGVDDLDAACAAVIAHGGEVLEESRLPNAVFVRDCEGQLVEMLAGATFARRLHDDA